MQKKKLFGTDGIRGKANHHPITCEVAIALGRVITSYFKTYTCRSKPRIIVGNDTRLSCYMLEMAVAAGICSNGGDVILIGSLPTPALAFTIISMRADVGVMITASHNSSDDNGLKIFDSRGFKLEDHVELELEKLINSKDEPMTLSNNYLGNMTRTREVNGRYIVHVKSKLDPLVDFYKMKVVLDCAHGSTYELAPIIFQELGVKISVIGNLPNGLNINEKYGSTDPAAAQKMVLKKGADLGFCFDGDGDRIVLIDHMGTVIDGDKVIGICAQFLLKTGVLKQGDTVVGTVMSNLGLEKYLHKLGLSLFRTAVGDRYIFKYMHNHNCSFGGEPSGHLIFSQYSTTGDGILTALKVMEALQVLGKNLRELSSEIPLYPYLIKNIKILEKKPLEEMEPLQDLLKNIQIKLGDMGRVLVRYSGTEKLLRIMVEASTGKEVHLYTEQLESLLLRILK